MAAPVNNVLVLAVIGLPFASAIALAVIPSWRVGIGVNAGLATLLFLLTCALIAYVPALPAAGAHLALLTSFVAMTTSWYGRRDIAALLSARLLGRQRVQLYHVAYQTLLGSILLAVLSAWPALSWLALAIAIAAAAVITGVMRSSTAALASSRLLTLCGVALVLALFGMVLFAFSPGLAGIFILVGYAGLAGLAPLHAWLPDAAVEAVPPGAIILGAAMVNAPLLLLFRLRAVIPPGLFVAVGLASLLIGSMMLFLRPSAKRAVALAGMAQLGMVLFAFGLGAPAASVAGWIQMTLLTLIRASLLQSLGSEPTQRIAVLALGLLPLFGLWLLAAPTIAHSVWLVLLLGTGALLTSLAILRLPVDATETLGSVTLIPIWLQLAIATLLALMPPLVTAWFHWIAAA